MNSYSGPDWTGLSHDDVTKWKHFPRYWPFVWGIHRSRVNSPHKGQWRGALMFSLICNRINGCVNNGEAGDLRRHRAHYDVTVMPKVLLLTMWTKFWLICSHELLLRLHDDVIKWKHFPRNWPFVWGIHRSRWIPRTKASEAELWCFLWSASW